MHCPKQNRLSPFRLLVFAGRDPRQRYKFICDAAATNDQIESNHIIVKRVFPPMIISLIRYLKKGRPDLVISVGAGLPGAFGFLFSKFIRRPFAIRLGGDPVAPMPQIMNDKKLAKDYPSFIKYKILIRLDAFIYRRTTFFFVVNDYLQRQLSMYSMFNQKIMFILPQFRAVSDKQKKVFKNFSKKSEINVLTITNFKFIEKYQGVKLLFNYLNEYCAKYGRHLKYTICGGGEHLYKVVDLKKIYTNPEFKVSIKGYQNDISPFYTDADVFLYCSGLDALPNVILEAMSFGLPVLVNDSEIFKDIIINGKNGSVFRENDPDSFFKKFHQIITNDIYRKKLMDKSFESVASGYSKTKVGQKLLDSILKIRKIEL